MIIIIIMINIVSIFEGILAGIIPSGSNLINSIRGVVSSVGTNNLNLTQYKKQQVPYFLQGNTSVISNSLTPYTINSLPQSSFILMNSSSINNNILNIKKSNLTALINDYYIGMNLNYINNTLYATAYYSTLAYHTSASIINNIDNLILQIIVGDNSKSLNTINSPLASSGSLSNTTNYLLLLACLDSLPISLLNFITSIIVAFIMSIMVISMTRERFNGSKQLQLLSGIHYSTYWISNYLFDLCVCILQLASMVIILKIVNAINNDSSSEVYAIANDDTLGYFCLLLVFSCFTWCTTAYIWSFLFKQEIIGFIVLLIILSVIAFLDTILTFIELLFQQNDGSASNPGAMAMYAIRLILTIIFPNVTVKRGMYNLKIRQNSYCISSVNSLLFSKNFFLF
jgi:hypothetical protein